nr:hypothetical protein Ade03nite_64250 [Actinoplanes derwentensis]
MLLTRREGGIPGGEDVRVTGQLILDGPDVDRERGIHGSRFVMARHRAGPEPRAEHHCQGGSAADPRQRLLSPAQYRQLTCHSRITPDTGIAHQLGSGISETSEWY